VASFSFVLGDGGSYNRSGFKSTISSHVEDINNVMGKAASSEVTVFLIVFHLEVSSRHLNHSVVNGFVSVENSLEVGILDGEQRSRSFSGFISGSHVD